MSPANDYYLPKRRLVSQQDAARIENANVPRSKFMGTWTRKTAFDAGYLVPIMVEEVLPGDQLNYEVTAYIRMATPLFPIFDSQRIDTFFFFVPNRLLWSNWQKFMGEQDNPGDSIAFTVPLVPLTAGGEAVGSIYDHFGIPTAAQIAGANILSINALPLRAYNLIYNEWFRDENSINAAVRNVDNGPDTSTDYALLRRAKSHDYFTSALPWAQKFTSPTIPLSGNAPIIGIGESTESAASGPLAVRETGNIAASYNNYGSFFGGGGVGEFAGKMIDAGGGVFVPDIYANMEAVSVAVESFRQAFMIQSLLERDARGGTRYVELIRSHFRVINPDFRLQRPEYIGGGSTPLNITPVAQTAPTAETPVGVLGGTGTAAGQHRASYAATEHGYIIGLINVKTELSYQQGLRKLWSRQTRFDFYFPALAQLGEQAVLRKEIYCVGDDGTLDDIVFGYQERWHEYRTHYSEVCGLMRSTETNTLDEWHLAQWFTAPPVLGAAFLNDDPPMERILAAGELAANQQYLADIQYRQTLTRPIPTFGTPATLGRY